MTLMSLQYLRETEASTQVRTRQELHGVYVNVPPAIDCLFKLNYFCGNTEPVTTDRGALQSHAAASYVTAPYTCASVYHLYETGNYLEASILLRSLFELLLSLRYFEAHPERFMAHATATRSRDRILFKNMLDDVAPESGDWHSNNYGLLSQLTHAGVAREMFRVQRTSPSDATVMLGNEFREQGATFVVNQFVVFLFGFLNRFPAFFPQNSLATNGDVNAQHQTSLQCRAPDPRRKPAVSSVFPDRPWRIIVERV